MMGTIRRLEVREQAIIRQISGQLLCNKETTDRLVIGRYDLTSAASRSAFFSSNVARFEAGRHSAMLEATVEQLAQKWRQNVSK